MSDSGVENGTKYEDLAQRVARLEGAVGDGRRYRRHGPPWWMLWALLWLAFPLFGGLPFHVGVWQPWRMGWWPAGVLLVVVLILLVRDRDVRGSNWGGKR